MGPNNNNNVAACVLCITLCTYICPSLLMIDAFSGRRKDSLVVHTGSRMLLCVASQYHACRCTHLACGTAAVLSRMLKRQNTEMTNKPGRSRSSGVFSYQTWTSQLAISLSMAHTTFKLFHLRPLSHHLSSLSLFSFPLCPLHVRTGERPTPHHTIARELRRETYRTAVVAALFRRKKKKRALRWWCLLSPTAVNFNLTPWSTLLLRAIYNVRRASRRGNY